jgi:hypothetical protein
LPPNWATPRSTISLVLAGKYAGRTDAVEKQVRAVLGSDLPFQQSAHDHGRLPHLQQ